MALLAMAYHECIKTEQFKGLFSVISDDLEGGDKLCVSAESAEVAALVTIQAAACRMFCYSMRCMRGLWH